MPGDWNGRVTGREARAVLAITTCLLLVAYWNVAFTGKSLVYSDNHNPLDPRFIEANYGPDFEPAQTWQRRNWIVYPNFHDAEAVWWQGEPGAEFLRRSLKRGEFPLWDPYVGGGAPALANLTQAFLFPPHLLVVALGNTSAIRNAYYLTLLLTAGFFTYLFLRRHGLTFWGALAGGIGFMLSGGLTQHAGSFVGQAAVCLPVTLFFTRWFVEQPDARRAAALALIYATVSLASFPPVLTQVFGISAAYAACMILCGQAGERRVHSLCCYAFVIIAALLVVAFYYLPAFRAMASSDQVQAVYRNAGFIGWAPVSLYQLMSPVLMGGAQVFQPPLMPGMQFYYVPYIGIVPLWLSGLADSRGGGRHGPLFMFTFITALLVALKIVGMPPAQWLGYLPGFNQIHFAQYYGIGLNFLLAVLAGIGTDNLLAKRVSSLRILVLVAVMILALLSLLLIAADRAVLETRMNQWLFEWILLLLFGLGAAAITIIAQRKRENRLLYWIFGIAVVMLLEAEAARNAYYPRQVRANVFQRPPPYAELMAKRGSWSRFLNLGPFRANTNSALEIYSWESLMTFNSTRSFEIFRRYTGTTNDLFLREAKELPPEPVLDAVAIDVIVIHSHDLAFVEAAKDRGYQKLFADGYVTLFVRQGDPRCFFTSDFRTMVSGAALEELHRPRPARQILIEHVPADLEAVANEPGDSPAVLTATGRNQWRLSIDAPRSGFLYCAENIFAGWTATVNGKTLPIMVANHAFRATRLDAGSNEVEFKYWPEGLTTGLWLSALGTFGILIAGLHGILRHRP